MTEDIDALKRDPAVLRYVMDKLSLKKEAGEYVTSCQFHSEKTPSMKIFVKDGVYLYFCFGCSAKGNLIQLIQKIENCSFGEAVEKVKDKSGWREDAAKVDAVFKPVADEKNYKVYTLAQYRQFENALKTSQPAAKWLEGRGISLETAQKLRVGFRQTVEMRPDSPDYVLKDGGWMVFGQIEGESVVGIKYRSIVRKVFSRQAGMRSGCFNLNTIDPFEDVMVVEGEIDALSLEMCGFRAVSLSNSTTALRPHEKDLLMAANRIILAGDNDGAGAGAMERLYRELPNSYQLKWPEGIKDANQFFLETCGGDISINRKKVEELTSKAAMMPMADVYSLGEALRNGAPTALKDTPGRLRMPWAEAEEMAIIGPGEVVSVFATQTGTGKTAWVTQLTLHNAMRYNRCIVNYQCEIPVYKFANGVAANLLNENRNHLQADDLKEAAKLLGDAKYYVGYNPNISKASEALDLIEAAIKRLSADIVVIDHIHFLCRNEQNEVQALANAMQRVVRMASAYKTIFIVVGQPKKADNTRRDKPVGLQDGKGSETYTSDAGTVFALHRQKVKQEEGSGPAKDTLESKTKVVCLKSRDKGEGNAEVDLLFIGEMCKFVALDRVHDDRGTGMQ